MAILAETNPKVKSGLDNATWDSYWFIADEVSNHQMGYAIDVSLAKVKKKELNFFGDYSVETVNEYKEYTMQTPIHELSSQSAIFSEPVSSIDKDLWKNSQIRKDVTKESLRLQEYCTKSGLTPLASEWWHFNDLEARDEIKDNLGNGSFILNDLESEKPTN